MLRVVALTVCGREGNRRARRHLARSRHRPGMVTRRVVAAFASIGWGGAWAGITKDDNALIGRRPLSRVTDAAAAPSDLA